MITAIVAFALPQPITREQARDTFQGTAPRYRSMPGLIRKTYFVTPDGSEAGGIYLWQSREAAEAVYTAEWAAFVRGKYGSDPRITWLESPVVVDNVTDTIVSD